MISTIHRRHILNSLQSQQTISLQSLRKIFVDSGEMNQTTLYRILDRFLDEGIIHRVDFGGEKYITLCQCGEKTEAAVNLKCCMSCHTIQESHSPLSPQLYKSETIELLRQCEKCPQIQ